MADLVERTHGRWPWGAAASAAPATLLTIARREQLARDGAWVFWAPLPVLFWHQTEEWVWPGGFLPFMNRDALGSDADEFPITRSLGLAINTGLGWGVAALAGALGWRAPALGAGVHGMLLGNALMHVDLSARRRRYTPGLATSVTLLGPVSVAGLVAVARHPRGGLRPALTGTAAGLLSGVATFAMLRRRARSRGHV